MITSEKTDPNVIALHRKGFEAKLSLRTRLQLKQTFRRLKWCGESVRVHKSVKEDSGTEAGGQPCQAWAGRAGRAAGRWESSRQRHLHAKLVP